MRLENPLIAMQGDWDWQTATTLAPLLRKGLRALEEVGSVPQFRPCGDR
jgi:hypothetical protein